MTDFLDLRQVSPSDPRSRALVNLLTEAIFERDEIVDVLRTVQLHPGDYPDRWSRLTWTAAVQDAAKKGRLRDLIDAITVKQPQFGRVWRAQCAALESEARVSSPWYTCPDPFESRFVGGGASRAMIDREGLRRGLRELVSDEYRVMVVTGSPRSGKSHSWRLVEHLREIGPASGVPPFRAVLVTTHDWSVPAKAEDVMAALVDNLGIDLDIRLTDELPESRARKLVNKLIGRYPDDGVLRWIVFDGLDRPGVQPEVVELVLRIARAANDGRLPKTRILVTGLNETIDSDLEGLIRREEIPALRTETFRDFFISIADHLNREIDENRLDEMIAEAVQGWAGNVDLGEVERAVYRLAHDRLLSSP